jgi:hypothetical protein
LRDRRSSFPAETARPLATRPSTPASSSPASVRGCQLFPLIPCVIRLRLSFSTSGEPTCATCRHSSAIRVSRQRRATPTLIPSGCARSSETSACTRSFLLFPMSQVRQTERGCRSYRSVRVVLISSSPTKHSSFSSGEEFNRRLARPLRRAVQKFIGDAVTDALKSSRQSSGLVTVSALTDRLIIE